MVDLSQISSYDIGNIIGKVDVAYRAIIIQEYETLVKKKSKQSADLLSSYIKVI